MIMRTMKLDSDVPFGKICNYFGNRGSAANLPLIVQDLHLGVHAGHGWTPTSDKRPVWFGLVVKYILYTPKIRFPVLFVEKGALFTCLIVFVATPLTALSNSDLFPFT